MSDQSFYNVLGVAHDATEAELKKAYRQLSLKYHPDRCSGEEAANMMRKVNEAYETLSDPASRQQYDFSLANGTHCMGKGNPPDMDMFFQQMFGGFPFAQMFGSAGGAGIEIIHGPGGATFIRQRQAPTTVEVSITLEQAFTGIAMPVSKPGTSEVEIVDIPSGIQNGQTLAVSPNFHVFVNVLQHDLFSRNGNDLFFKKSLSLKEALCGTQVSFTHLNGKHMTLNITNVVVSPGMRKSFPGMGFTTNGNLVVEFEVTFPAVLTQEQRDTLQTLL